MVIGQGIKAKCKRCGKDSPADSFTLDPVFGMMVCPNCVNERKNKSFSLKKGGKDAAAEPTEKPKPKGWDAEDEMLEKSFKSKQADLPKVEVIDDEKVKYSCYKCKYKFVYNIEKKQPPRCPYCNAEISKFKF